MKMKWQHLTAGLFLAASLASAGFAQDAATASIAQSRSAGARRGGGFGFAATLERTVNLTPEQSDAVRGLLADQRRQSQALRTQTDAKIRALLKPEQQKKFDAFIAELKARRPGRRPSAV